MTSVFEKHCQEGNRFIKNLALQLGQPDDLQHALRVLRSVLHGIRNRIIPDESMHIISQLPLLLKGIYVDGWDFKQPLSKAQTFDDFLYDVRNTTERGAGGDFADDESARTKVTAVFNALKEFVDEGELQHLRDGLPKEIAEVI